MKHVLFLPGWYANLRGQGGGAFFREQAAVLRNRGWDVRILYADLRPIYSPRSVMRFDIDAGVPVLRYQTWAPPKLGRLTIRYWQHCYLQAFAQYRAKWGSPELIHAHSYLGGLAAAAIRRKHGIPYLLTEHLGKLTQPPELLPRRIRRAICWAYSSADGLYGVSRALANSMAAFTSQTITGVLPNMVDTDFFHPGLTEKKENDDFLLCSIGDPWHRKGLDVLIEAVGLAQRETSRTLRLILADKIPGRSALSPLIRRWSLQQQIEFIGQVSKSAIRELLSCSDVCVSASRYESFGVTMIESLACGTPVIATRTAGGREIVREGENGFLVDIGNADQLAKAVLRILAHQKKFREKQLRDPIIADYSYASVAGRIEAAYYRVMTT